MSEKKRILQNTMKNSYSQLIVKVFGVIQGLIVANILGPALYGIKNAFSLFQQYGNYSGLGVFSVYYRTLCEKIDDADCANNMNSDIFGFVVFVSFVLFILFTGIAFLFFNSVAERLTLIIIALGVISSIFCSFYRFIFLSKQNFNVTSMANILSSFVLLVFGILLTYFYHVLGFFIAVMISSLIVLLYYIFKLKYIPKVTFNFRLYWQFIKDGMFNFINGLAFLIIFSIGRIIIISEYGATALGYYAVGLFFAGLVDFALSSLILPLNPNIYKYANDKSKLIKYIILPENLIYRILYYLVFVIIYLVPFVIFIVPKYGPGIVYIDILIFATIFLPRLITSLFFALRKELITMYVLISIIALSLILNLTIAYFDLGMIYIAFTTLITLFLYGQIMHLMGYKEILGSYRLAIKEIFNYLWPLGYALLGYGLLWMLAHFLLYDFMNYYLVKIIQAILFTVWYSPILWKIEKEHKLVAMLWTNLKNRFRKKGFIEEQQIG